MGKRDCDISPATTGESGRGFVDGVLTPDQRAHIPAIIDMQRKAIMADDVRREISVEPRKFLMGETSDQAKVVALGQRYGELDGEMSWPYASAFAAVGKTLTADYALVFGISWGGILVLVGPGGIPGTGQQVAMLMPIVLLALCAGPSVAGSVGAHRGSFLEELGRMGFAIP